MGGELAFQHTSTDRIAHALEVQLYIAPNGSF